MMALKMVHEPRYKLVTGRPWMVNIGIPWPVLSQLYVLQSNVLENVGLTVETDNGNGHLHSVDPDGNGRMEPRTLPPAD